MERRILEAVARADLIVCQALQVMATFAVVLLILLVLIELSANPKLTVIVDIMICVLLAVLLIVHHARGDPYYLPYDVTSEGPDDDYTAAWVAWQNPPEFARQFSPEAKTPCPESEILGQGARETWKEEQHGTHMG